MRVTCVKLAAGNSGTPVVVALLPDAGSLDPPDVEAVATGLEKDVTASVLPGVEIVVLPPGTVLLLSVLVGSSNESVGNGRLGISEDGTLIVGSETTPEIDDVRFQPTPLLWVTFGGSPEFVGRDTDTDSGALVIVSDLTLPDKPVVVFQPDTTVPFRSDMDVPPENVGGDALNDVLAGKVKEPSVCVGLVVGTEALPVGREVVPFLLGPPVLTDVEPASSDVVESESLGSDSVGNGMKVPVREILAVGVEKLPPG